MNDSARIVLDSAVLAGKPVIRGTRLSVDFVIGLMADGWTEADILRNYPGDPRLRNWISSSTATSEFWWTTGFALSVSPISS